MKKTLVSILVIVIVIIGIVILVRQPNKQAPEQAVLETEEQTEPERLSIMILEEGTGDALLQPGQTAVVHYTGFLTDGVVFDSSLTRGTPLEFVFGTGSVIQGWEKGLENMKIGEKRQLVIPPAFGYGDRQVGPIAPNSTLIFDVELIDIK